MITSRIIRKSKEGVTLKSKDVKEPITATWKEFEENYTIDPNDKFKAIMKPELEAKVVEASKIADEVVMHIMMSNSTNPATALAGLSGISTKTEQFCKLMDCSLAEGMKLIRMKMEQFVSAGVKEGIGFGKPYNNFMNDSQRRRNKENIRKLDKERENVKKSVDTTDAYHYTLGDAIKIK